MDKTQSGIDVLESSIMRLCEGCEPVTAGICGWDC